MYDHLDDSDPPYPGADARQGVRTRARFLRRRRLAAIGSTGTAVVAVVVLTLVSLSGSTPRASSSVTYVSPSSESSQDAERIQIPTPAGDLTPSSSPTAPSKPHGTPTRHVPATTVTPTEPPGVFGGCQTNTTVPSGPASQDVVDGLKATLAVPDSVAAGQDVTGTLTFVNSTDQDLTLRIESGPADPLLVLGAGGYYGDVIRTSVLEVPAGGSRQLDRSGRTTRCDQGQLAPGSHQVGSSIVVESVTTAAAGPAATPTGGLGDVQPSASSTPDPAASPSPAELLPQRRAFDFGGSVQVV